MKSSESLDKIAEALAKAQGQMQNPSCNKTVKIPGKYSFDYADLSAVLNVIKKPLADNGLCHVVTLDHETSVLECRLIHISGQFISSSWPLQKNSDPKQMAGSITYAKRYLLAALVGIAADEDKDDNDANETVEVSDRKPKPTPEPSQGKPLTKPEWRFGPEQVSELENVMKAVGCNKEFIKTFCSQTFKKEVHQLNETEYKNFIIRLNTEVISK